MGRTVTVNLPDTLYQRMESAAAVTSLSLEEVLQQTLARSELWSEELPPDIHANLSALALLSDDALWQTARSMLEEEKQLRLEELVEARKAHTLTSAEEQEIDALLAEGEWVMLKRAEAYRLLTQRGFTIPWING